jgi:hypothetical protein
MLFKVENIKWDCDGEDPKNLNLPIESAQIESDDIDDVIDDLSDKYGFLIESVEQIYYFDPDTSKWVDASNE